MSHFSAWDSIKPQAEKSVSVNKAILRRGHFFAQRTFFAIAQKGDFQTVNLRLANLFAAQSCRWRGDVIFMDNIYALNSRIVRIKTGENAMLKEGFEWMIRQRCDGTGLNIRGQTGFNTDTLLCKKIH